MNSITFYNTLILFTFLKIRVHEILGGGSLTLTIGLGRNTHKKKVVSRNGIRPPLKAANLCNSNHKDLFQLFRLNAKDLSSFSMFIQNFKTCNSL